MPRIFEPFFTTKPPGQGEHAVAATGLVAEDEPTVSRLMRRVLERDGFQVRVAASGREVLDHWNLYELSVDLVITDLVMPGGVSGRQLAAEQRRLEPTLPIVFSSGYDPDFDPSNETMVPGENFIPKLSTAEQILAVVRRQLSTRGSSI